jgi:hypothetical protein
VSPIVVLEAVQRPSIGQSGELGRPSILVQSDGKLGFGMRYAILISLLLMGCSTSDPIRVGDNRYMISTTSYTGWSTRAGQIQRAMDDANDFCHKRGKVAQLQSDNSQGQPAITPVSENVVFTCVNGP